MKEIAVVSLSRLGDHIQSTPLLRLLKRSWPEARITLIAERRFAAILPLMRGFDRVFTFDKSETANLIFDPDPLAAYAFVDRFVAPLEQDSYDLVVNITFSPLSAYLCSLLRSRSCAGLTVGKKGERNVRSPWGMYLFATQMGDNRIHNRINLVDIFSRTGGMHPDGRPIELFETEKGRTFADEFVRSGGLGGQRLIGIQLGASSHSRRWPAESFARLSDLLQREGGCRTILFGSRDESHLAESALAAMQLPAVSAVGKTGIEELFSLVRKCSLMVSNDTGTMHFAAAGGVPAVMICIGPAFFRGTGPYSAGNLALVADIPCAPCPYSLQCDNQICKEAVSVEAVHRAAVMALDGRAHPAEEFSGVKVYRSRFGADGYLEWEGIRTGTAVDEAQEDRFARMWKLCLDGGTDAPRAPSSTEARELSHLMERGIAISEELGRRSAERPLPIERIRALGDMELALDGEIRLLATRYPLLSPLVDFLAQMRENMTAEDLADSAAETCSLYQTGWKMAAFL
jgi:ADP-heptose:LPS heptosyltransferase